MDDKKTTILVLSFALVLIIGISLAFTLLAHKKQANTQTVAETQMETQMANNGTSSDAGMNGMEMDNGMNMSGTTSDMTGEQAATSTENNAPAAASGTVASSSAAVQVSY